MVLADESPNVDWQAVERDYVTGGDHTTYRALAERYGVAPKTIRNRGSRDDWADKRRVYRAEAGTLALQKSKDLRAADIAAEEIRLQSAWTETMFEMLERARTAEKAHEARDYITAAAICADKRRQSLYPDGAAGAQAYEKVTVTREQWITGEWRQRIRDEATIAGS
ncbi:MAG: hypothetical protein KKI08_06570 [Armatimonadetes bacterium]|nr:hypothetical protein [Armatimonadota bacterium]